LKLFNTIDEAIADLKQGKVIIVCDDENRENEGDFLAIAENITPESINLMITHGKGLVCSPVGTAIAKRLGLEQMVRRNRDNMQTAFSQSIDHVDCTTGISAYERYLTLSKMADPKTGINDFRAPGHVFPLLAKPNGVLERPGHTEAAVDLARLAGFSEAGVICEIINPDGTMARLPELSELAKKFDLKLIHIKDLIDYRKLHEQLIEPVASSLLPTKHGTFEMFGYRCLVDNQEIVALVKGNSFDQNSEPLVRIHSECLTGDGFGSLRCDCGEQLAASLERIEKDGGILIYLRQEGRGIGLLNKIKAYQLQDQGMDTVEANLHLGFPDDMRDYYLAAQVLRNLGVSKIQLLSNNPRKFSGLEKYGVKIANRQELIVPANPTNQDYLNVKANKLGHLF